MIYNIRMPKNGKASTFMANNQRQHTFCWLQKLQDDSDSEEEPILPAPAPASATPTLMPLVTQDTSPERLREWNLNGIPATLPYHKTSRPPPPRPQEDSWTSITHITPPHELATKGDVDEITYTNTIDHTSIWTERVMSAFEKASAPQKSELSDEFKQNLTKLSFFRRPLIPKQ
jgi:hypothetical protein